MLMVQNYVNLCVNFQDKLYSGSHNTIDIWSVTEPFSLKGKVDHQFGSIYSLAVTSRYIIAGRCLVLSYEYRIFY